jgi:serine/threonine protein kinase
MGKIPIWSVVMEWRYRSIELRGKGAFGDVYRAEDLVLRRIVAKKVLRVCNEENVKRFKRDDAMLRKQVQNPSSSLLGIWNLNPNV